MITKITLLFIASCIAGRIFICGQLDFVSLLYISSARLTMHKNPILSIRDLSVVFDTGDEIISAIEGVSLEVFPGEVLGLVGESGSGKSVTALAVMRLLSRSTARISSGEIWFGHPEKGMVNLPELSDMDMQSLRGRHMAMIFQEPMTSLNPVKRCGPQVAESILWHRRSNASGARKKALDLFREVRLPRPEKIYQAWPHELSGGQKQRVMIAMAMACDPALLIADEPTTALDVTVQQDILELLKSLQERHKMAVMFISHDLGVIAQVAGKICVMRNGRVMEEGPASRVLNEPSNPYTRALLACRPSLEERPVRLSEVEDFMGEKSEDHENIQSPPWSGSPDAAAVRQSESRVRQSDNGVRQSEDKAIQPEGRAPKKEPVLEIKNLSTRFITRRNMLGRPLEHHTAVADVSFRVYRGETLGLVGESGCGKTTLGRTIMQLIRPDSGDVLYKGMDLSKMSSGELRRLRTRFQIIFQDPYASLSPGMSIGRAIMEPMQVHGMLENNRERKARVMELLEKVGLEPWHFDRYPHAFSGGQRQRICIARALAMNPEFIICDESVSALDVSVQAKVLNLLNDLKREYGLTYIFISHDLAVVKYMSDRIIVMKDGRIVECGEADSLYASPREAYTKKLIGAIPAF